MEQREAVSMNSSAPAQVRQTAVSVLCLPPRPPVPRQAYSATVVDVSSEPNWSPLLLQGGI